MRTVFVVLLVLAAGIALGQAAQQPQQMTPQDALDALHSVAYKYVSVDGKVLSIPRVIEDAQAIERAYTVLAEYIADAEAEKQPATPPVPSTEQPKEPANETP
jgi:hypothetical protein